MMNEVSIPYENFIFIDCGSGKGAVLLLASDYPFKKIIGVEYCKALHAAATRNLAVYQSPTRKCTDIQCVCADATAFPIPPEPAVLYFYNPFDEVLMHQVVGVIEQSRNAVPRKLIVIYFNPVHGDAFRDSGLWTEIVKRETYVIFESRG
jgi:predicted RNA methylase